MGHPSTVFVDVGDNSGDSNNDCVNDDDIHDDDDGVDGDYDDDDGGYNRYSLYLPIRFGPIVRLLRSMRQEEDRNLLSSSLPCNLHNTNLQERNGDREAKIDTEQKRKRKSINKSLGMTNNQARSAYISSREVHRLLLGEKREEEHIKSEMKRNNKNHNNNKKTHADISEALLRLDDIVECASLLAANGFLEIK